MAVIEEKKESKVAAKKVTKKAAPKKQVVEIAENADIAYKVLVEPWITEKSHAAIANNKYTFKVTRKATKNEVKKAVEGMYKVKVEKVTVVNVKARKRAYGRHEGVIAGFKKATLTLQEGNKIEFFQGA